MASRRYVSYMEKKTSRGKIFRFIRLLILFFLVYGCISAVFVRSYRIGSVSMEPLLKEGDCVIVAPIVYGIDLPFTDSRIPGLQKPQRGDLVAVAPAYDEGFPWYYEAAELVVRFLTLQKVSILPYATKAWTNERLIKRIVGVPGDTIRIDEHAVYIQSTGKDIFFHERDIIQKDYSIIHVPMPQGYEKSFPFSGTLGEIKLNEDEYFVLGDNRVESNDSSYWGPVPISHIKGKVVLQYWPKFRIP
ncbi:MAG TPA: signal peptidase I [Spirochaetia bacterium]|nr:signal peptidase I [Spirochaetia bacterium]